MWTLISATPSPYARKVRVALAEKGLPFKLQTEVPWDSTTQTPQWNPLEKLPVLILDDGKTAVYESHFILEWLEAKYPDTSMLPSDLDDKLFAKQVEVLCDGICDALVLAFWERHRDVEKQSAPWTARQMRKAEGGLRTLAAWVDRSQSQGSKFLVGNKLSLADLAAVSMLGWLNVRWPDHQWQTTFPQLKRYWETLETRESFATTRPTPQTMKDQIV